MIVLSRYILLYRIVSNKTRRFSTLFTISMISSALPYPLLPEHYHRIPLPALSIFFGCEQKVLAGDTQSGSSVSPPSLPSPLSFCQTGPDRLFFLDRILFSPTIHTVSRHRLVLNSYKLFLVHRSPTSFITSLYFLSLSPPLATFLCFNSLSLPFSPSLSLTSPGLPCRL